MFRPSLNENKTLPDNSIRDDYYVRAVKCAKRAGATYLSSFHLLGYMRCGLQCGYNGKTFFRGSNRFDLCESGICCIANTIQTVDLGLGRGPSTG